MNNPTCVIAAEKAGLTERDLIELAEVSKSIAESAGNLLMEHYGNLNNIENKGRIGDLVTDADLDAESLVLKHLKERTPEIAILAEESGNIGPSGSLKWCVDPLDGTTNFAHGYPFFGTSIGLTWQNKPLLGAISVPYLKQIYWGAPPIGSFCNKQKLSVSRCSKLVDSLLVTGFAYDRQTRLDNNYAEFCWMTHRTRGVRRGGASAIDLAFVASGIIDGYWERGLSAWDLAAGTALVEMSGGTVTNYLGGEFDITSGRVLACTPGIHKHLINELAEVKPLYGSCFGAPELQK